MLTIADLDFFSAVARAPSLAAAARDLDVTPSAVTQRLQDLERRVGVRLVDRSARRITLTDEGELLALQGRAITDDVAALTETLAARRGEVAGHLVRLLDHYRPPSADVVAFVGPRRGRSARTSRFVQSLRDSLTPTPWRC